MLNFLKINTEIFIRTMQRKKIKPETIEQKSYIQFNPESIKQSVEIPVKQVNADELETVEESKGAKKQKKPKKSKAKKEPAQFEEKSLKKHGYVLVITEKPQAASKIAAALSDGSDQKLNKSGVPYYELSRNNKKIIVACAVGHLFTVSQSKKGTDYPIFDIAWYPNFEVNKKDFTKKYYMAIKELLKNASEIVIATDFDVEGEVIGYNIVRFIANQKDAKRMKFSSLTTKEIQDSYDNSLPTIEWGQAIAGETRHFLDWLYGINLSRALMNSIKKTGKFKIMSIGRVQGPTLNLIVEKEKQIQAFKSTPYWQVFLTINDNNNKIKVKYNKDITKKQELDKFKELKGKKATASTKNTKQIIIPPAPFDLTTLQTEAYKFYSITPSQTLQIAQKLYLGGLISYPRTSSQKIPDAMNPLEIIKKLERFFSKQTENVTRKKPVEGSKSDPAHPAIIPTGVYQKLESSDQKIYELIVKRFISCFCSDAELKNKKIEVEIDGMKFSAKGMGIINPGWMNVYPIKMEEKEIPDFNGSVIIEEVEIEEKMTQPPKRFSPASIISELEKRNLGTKATRSNIVETLYSRNYIKDRSIQATELGIRLIDSLKKYSPIIIDEKLTREIEKDMENIRVSKKDLGKKQNQIIKKAEESLTKISKDFKKKELEIGEELFEANQSLWKQQKEDNILDIICPKCNKSKLTLKYTNKFKSYFVACSDYPNCKQTYSLPKALIKKLEDNRKCKECNWPMLISIKKEKRPWIFCFNPACPSRKRLIENNSENHEN